MKNVNTATPLKDRALLVIDAYLNGDNHMTNSGLSENLICALGGYEQCVDVGLDYRDACEEILNALSSPDPKIDIFHKTSGIELMKQMYTFFNDLYYNDDMKSELEKECILVYDPYDDEQLENLIKRYELKKQLDDLERDRWAAKKGQTLKEAA